MLYCCKLYTVNDLVNVSILLHKLGVNGLLVLYQPSNTFDTIKIRQLSKSKKVTLCISRSIQNTLLLLIRNKQESNLCGILTLVLYNFSFVIFTWIAAVNSILNSYT